MGIEQYTTNPKRNKRNDLNIDNIKLTKSLFDFLYVIGRGGFGKVWKVLLKKTSKYYALKEMSKMKIILKRSEKSIQSERELLSNLYHPFIVNMISAFQDFNNLYLVMDLFKGGDLRYHIFLNKKFNERQSKFFISNIILGLEYIHKNKIIHRDIKPENLVLDQNGYVAITDFGIAKKVEKSSLPDASGTPGYMAPEVLFSQIHTFAVDFYAVGVIAFEFMKGFRPYQGRDRKEIKEAILAKEIGIGPKSLKYEGWSLEGGDFINRMIKRKVRKRLGFYGINEIKNHAWFRDINWNELLMKKLKSPYIPKDGDNFDKKFCEFTNEFYKDNNIKEKYNNIVKQKDYLNLFKNYTYIRKEEKDKVIKDLYYSNDYDNNNNMNKELKKSLSKIIKTNKKSQERIMDYYNDENKNILNYNYDNDDCDKNKLSKSKTMNYFFPAPKNNKKVFHKKRVSSKDSKINSISKNKSLTLNKTNNNNKDNRNNNNNIIIINPYYNQNINYYQEKEYDKDKIEINYNYNTLDAKNIRINNINNNNIFTYKKNLSPKINQCNSMKTIKSNFDFQRIGDYNNVLNNIEKECMIYSPPHILSPKFKSTRNTTNSKIKYGTLDYIINNSQYNTINQLNNNFDNEKQMILNKLENKNNAINNKNNKINKSDILNVKNRNNNNYFYSTLNKFHNRLASEKILYSSFSSTNKNENKINPLLINNNNNTNQINLYNSRTCQIKKDKNVYTDKNNFNKSKRVEYNIESYSKRNKIYENMENIPRKKMSRKTILNYYNSNIEHNNKNFETINHINTNNNKNIFKIKVNLIPKPYSISKIENIQNY